MHPLLDSLLPMLEKLLTGFFGAFIVELTIWRERLNPRREKTSPDSDFTWHEILWSIVALCIGTTAGVLVYPNGENISIWGNSFSILISFVTASIIELLIPVQDFFKVLLNRLPTN